VRTTPVPRAEFERLRADHARLVTEMNEVRETMRQMRVDLQVQFVRIAEMQAILDEHRIAEQRNSTPVYPIQPGA
jgi:hypothetical protein